MFEIALAGVGAAALLVWPSNGPSALVRERVLRPVLRRVRGDGVLDCVVCASVWGGLACGLATEQGWGALLVACQAAAVSWGVVMVRGSG